MLTQSPGARATQTQGLGSPPWRSGPAAARANPGFHPRAAPPPCATGLHPTSHPPTPRDSAGAQEGLRRPPAPLSPPFATAGTLTCMAQCSVPPPLCPAAASSWAPAHRWRCRGARQPCWPTARWACLLYSWNLIFFAFKAILAASRPPLGCGAQGVGILVGPTCLGHTQEGGATLEWVGLDSATKLELVERPRTARDGVSGPTVPESSALWGGCTARPDPMGWDLGS